MPPKKKKGDEPERMPLLGRATNNVGIGIVEGEYAIEGTKLQVLIDNKLRDAFVRERPFNPKLKPFM